MLALVLLALPGPAMRHASAATPVQQAAAEHCGAHIDAAALMQAAPMHTASGHTASGHASVSAEELGQPCGRSGGEQGLPCCVAAQCASAVDALPHAQAGPLPSPGAVVRDLAPAHARFGIEIPPSLPPPRQVA
ncbi:hypothetical protein [Roseicella sp. DB1501]|uniref:hypothetical protein n=1 Tax=Roseicella sp. DB1501 TaxID=2730925 RepID=UPI0014911DC3|nr:hypothetical protein [Roseicella sp. DB1501]NOG73610.1 hypothetical protein [Roseicella sp. DB1501]